MKRYLLFGFYEYYPKGGLNDIEASFNDINELDLNELYCDYSYYQLLDLKNRQYVNFDMKIVENEIDFLRRGDTSLKFLNVLQKVISDFQLFMQKLMYGVNMIL